MTTTRSFFQAGPASPDYELMRDDLGAEVSADRKLIEEMWLAFAPHADPEFRQDARRNFLGRFWELYLFALFRSVGLSPRGQPNGGPDFVLETSEGRASVEAIAPTVGRGPDGVPEVEWGRASELPNPQLVLRLTAAMEEKSQKGLRYLDKGLLGAEEPFAIAINGAAHISSHSDARVPEGFQVPRILQVLFGIGPYQMFIDPSRGVVSEGFSGRSTVSKQSGVQVPSALFRSDAHAHVSAVIFGLEYARSFELSGENILLVHNPFARAPWPRGLLKRGVEYWQEGDRVAWTDWDADCADGSGQRPSPTQGVDEIP